MRRQGGTLAFESANGETDSGYLPTAVVEWAGMKSHRGKLTNDIAGDSLATMNDTGDSFTQIADTIRKNWAVL